MNTNNNATSLEECHQMLLDIDDEDIKGTTTSEPVIVPTSTPLTKPQILKLDKMLNPEHYGEEYPDIRFFPEVIQPYILYSMLGTLRHWANQTSSKGFLHTSWFHQWGFRKAFLYSFATAYSRLPYQRFEPTTDINTALSTLNIQDIDHNNLKLNLFWSVNLQEYGTGYCGYSTNKPAAGFYGLILPHFLAYLLKEIKAQTPNWPWDNRKGQRADIQLVSDCYTFHTEPPYYGTLDFNSIQLQDTLNTSQKPSRIKAQRCDTKNNLRMVGLQHFVRKSKDFVDASVPLFEPLPIVVESVDVSTPMTVSEPPVVIEQKQEPDPLETQHNILKSGLEANNKLYSELASSLACLRASIHTYSPKFDELFQLIHNLIQHNKLEDRRLDAQDKLINDLNEQYSDLEMKYYEQAEAQLTLQEQVNELRVRLRNLGETSQGRFTRADLQPLPLTLGSPDSNQSFTSFTSQSPNL